MPKARVVVQSPGGPGCFSEAADAVLVAGQRPKRYNLSMKLQDIEQEALGLSEKDRADLVLSLMNTLAAPGADVTDEEVLRRDAELEEGSVEPLSHEEFVRRVHEERGR
jgi:hypothetical protein